METLKERIRQTVINNSDLTLAQLFEIVNSFTTDEEWKEFIGIFGNSPWRASKLDIFSMLYDEIAIELPIE